LAPAFRALRDAGAAMAYRARPGVHDFDYGAEELPRIARFLERHPRDPHPARIDWESGDDRFGRLHWLALRGVRTGEVATWHRDANATLVDAGVSIGPARRAHRRSSSAAAIGDLRAEVGLRPATTVG
jgi:hypothetical protein